MPSNKEDKNKPKPRKKKIKPVLDQAEKKKNLNALLAKNLRAYANGERPINRSVNRSSSSSSSTPVSSSPSSRISSPSVTQSYNSIKNSSIAVEPTVSDNEATKQTVVLAAAAVAAVAATEAEGPHFSRFFNNVENKLVNNNHIDSASLKRPETPSKSMKQQQRLLRELQSDLNHDIPNTINYSYKEPNEEQAKLTSPRKRASPRRNKYAVTKDRSNGQAESGPKTEIQYPGSPFQNALAIKPTPILPAPESVGINLSLSPKVVSVDSPKNIPITYPPYASLNSPNKTDPSTPSTPLNHSDSTSGKERLSIKITPRRQKVNLSPVGCLSQNPSSMDYSGDNSKNGGNDTIPKTTGGVASNGNHESDNKKNINNTDIINRNKNNKRTKSEQSMNGTEGNDIIPKKKKAKLKGKDEKKLGITDSSKNKDSNSTSNGISHLDGYCFSNNSSDKPCITNDIVNNGTSSSYDTSTKRNLKSPVKNLNKPGTSLKTQEDRHENGYQTTANICIEKKESDDGEANLVKEETISSSRRNLRSSDGGDINLSSSTPSSSNYELIPDEKPRGITVNLPSVLKSQSLFTGSSGNDNNDNDDKKKKNQKKEVETEEPDFRRSSTQWECSISWDTSCIIPDDSRSCQFDILKYGMDYFMQKREEYYENEEKEEKNEKTQGPVNMKKDKRERYAEKNIDKENVCLSMSQNKSGYKNKKMRLKKIKNRKSKIQSKSKSCSKPELKLRLTKVVSHKTKGIILTIRKENNENSERKNKYREKKDQTTWGNIRDKPNDINDPKKVILDLPSVFKGIGNIPVDDTQPHVGCGRRRRKATVNKCNKKSKVSFHNYFDSDDDDADGSDKKNTICENMPKNNRNELSQAKFLINKKHESPQFESLACFMKEVYANTDGSYHYQIIENINRWNCVISAKEKLIELNNFLRRVLLSTEWQKGGLAAQIMENSITPWEFVCRYKGNDMFNQNELKRIHWCQMERVFPKSVVRDWAELRWFESNPVEHIPMCSKVSFKFLGDEDKSYLGFTLIKEVDAETGRNLEFLENEDTPCKLPGECFMVYCMMCFE